MAAKKEMPDNNKKKPYSSIIDALLADREPDWKDLDLADAQKSGEDVADWSHQYVDTEFEDDLAESASKHTPIWGPKSGTHTYEDRIAEKEAAAPRIVSVTAYRREDEYKSNVGDNDSLMDEVTESLDSAYSGSNLAENSAAKKEVSDAQALKYVRDLLNQGVAPAKVAQKLDKLAEIELDNRQQATDYLQRNSGLLGLAYLEPNTYLDKNSPTYEHTASEDTDAKQDPNARVNEYLRDMAARGFEPIPETVQALKGKSSNACVQQKRAWDKEGIKPQAHSVKQVTACQGCAYFKKNGSAKTCNLYHLPLVASVKELQQIVNHLTPGVPEKRKHAALVVLANGDGKRVQNPKVAEQTNMVKTADAKVRNQGKRASYQFSDNRETSKHFSSEHVAALHGRGASLEQIFNWAEGKFGSVDASLAFRGFVQSLKKNAKEKIVVASRDLSFLNSIGIRNAAFEGGEKCASCEFHKKALLPDPNHDWQAGHDPEPVSVKPCVNCGAEPSDFSYDRHGEVFCESCGETQPVSQQDFLAYQRSGKMGSKAPRVATKFMESSSHIAASKQADAEAEIVVTASKVRTLHQAGHSVAKIYKGAARKVGSVEARKAVAGFVEDMKKRPGKIAVSESDRAFLVGKLGFKPEQVRMLDPQRRPVTQVVASVPDDQHLLSYPGMKQAAEKTAKDGHSILAEFDLTGNHDMQDIEPIKNDYDVQMDSTFKLE